MGLLSVASGKKGALSANSQSFSTMSFQQWAEENGFEHCGVFCERNGLMMLECAYGIDTASVFRSISTKDFWLGSARSDTWITIDSESPNYSAFTQFLGTEARSLTKAFRIMKISVANGFMIFFEYSYKPIGILRRSQDFSQELKSLMQCRKKILLEKPSLEDTERLLENMTARLCLISTKRALDETVKKIEVSELTIQQTLLNTIFEEIFYKTQKLFAPPAALYSEDIGEIKIAAPISSNTEDESLKEQLSLEYESLIGKEASKKIIILTAGYSSDSEETLDYLLRG